MAGNNAYQLDPGPLELSVLTEQLTHRSRDIWDGNVNMILNTRRCDDKFWDLVKKYLITPQVLEAIQLSRLYGVYRSHWPMIDRRTGEETITLQDVEVLYGLLVNDDFNDYGKYTSESFLKLMYEAMLKVVNAIRPYSWGSATLACLYRFLCKSSQSNQHEIARFLPLLQIYLISK
ncbi:hypothetical protein H5410_005093 [Solanum commersonii]|uniref:Uncharacterized protein n=1 Tax=Solanum commersonii TaxID=4109 RepID=A0A9J6A6G1_SOLCO|nr:hypothetical protein H5410_005093 [Solanum commersonii]